MKTMRLMILAAFAFSLNIAHASTSAKDCTKNAGGSTAQRPPVESKRIVAAMLNTPAAPASVQTPSRTQAPITGER